MNDMSSTNILRAICYLVNRTRINLGSTGYSANRMNSMGVSLEEYIKDLFSESFDVQDQLEKNNRRESFFAYLGNQNNPPDIIIRHGDVIEVKKTESPTAELALNSSYPKDKLYSDDPMISNSCRTCEQWTVKDTIYAVGTIKADILKQLWFVHGQCYAASKETYEAKKSIIATGLRDLPGLNWSNTNELGRINEIDPLGITYLRVRGMWGIKHPNNVFGSIINNRENSNFSFHALLLKSKYEDLPQQDQRLVENLMYENFSITDVRIPSPNNPATLLDAKYINYYQNL